jgi:ribose transport system permease protein
MLTLIVAALNLLNVGSAWHPFVTGAIVLLALLVDALAARGARH